MSDLRDKKPKLRPGEVGYVGRGVPPTDTRIKPKEVRNPWGSRGKPRPGEPPGEFVAEMREFFAQPIRAKDGKTFTQAELIFNGMVNGIGKGDIRAMKLYIELREKCEPKSSPEESTAMIDDRRQRLIDEALDRLEAKRASADRLADDALPEVDQQPADECPKDGEES